MGIKILYIKCHEYVFLGPVDFLSALNTYIYT